MDQRYRAIVIGVSAGGMNALTRLFSQLPADLKVPILVTQHLLSTERSFLAELLDKGSNLMVKEATDKEKIESGTVYIAPPNYHLLIEQEQIISLSNEEKVNYSRPSIDVMFESASLTWEDQLIGIILTGSNSDGALGIKKIKEYGGLTIAENPLTAEYPTMPQSAINLGVIDHIFNLEQISEFIQNLFKGKSLLAREKINVYQAENFNS